VQLGVHAGLSSRRSRVQIPSGPPPGNPVTAGKLGAAHRGRVAQLAERAPEKREVTGSTPVPTTEKFQFRAASGLPAICRRGRNGISRTGTGCMGQVTDLSRRPGLPPPPRLPASGQAVGTQSGERPVLLTMQCTDQRLAIVVGDSYNYKI
jgi:hypothetical protein